MATRRICSAPDCGKPVYCNALCQMHDMRIRRGGSLERRAPKLSLSELLRGETRFGMWTVLGEAAGVPRPGNGVIRYASCRCDCGTERAVSINSLKRGTSLHCGCLISSIITDMKTVHGGCGTPEYRSWAHLKERCLNPNNKDWKDYGGRGISVCERWLGSFAGFIADMGPRPSPKHSIDRIDVNGNYEPGNCRWADPVTQRNNQRR
jgi:hypothetical protein